ncbi:MAG: S41 family peptidase [Bacteroidota bacterium]|nr:S41 family peptidase [Bacteroidota bacterium]
MENKKIPLYLPIVLAVVLVVGMFLGIKLSNNQTLGLLQSNRSGNKIDNLINFLNDNYVDTVNRDKLYQQAIEGMLQSLDPHSSYIPAEDFSEVNDPMTGGFEGIGVEFRLEKDSIVIVNTIPLGPSERVGLRGGDRIVKVGSTLVAGKKITNAQVMKLLKGPKGTKVNISVYRRGTRGLIDFTIIRDRIPINSVDCAYMVQPGVGYIKLNKFAESTIEEFDQSLQKLLKSGMKKLILDLRGNPGGIMQSAIHIADQFLSDGKLIVYTQGQHSPKESAFAKGEGLFKNHPLVVLIDENSASASEILAGAIQDNDRGLIIGRRSFGKGLVQQQLSFKDGSAVRVTIARYYTPTGRCIQRSYKNGTEEYYNDYLKRLTSGELTNADSIKFNHGLKYKTPGGRIVYGGGGIMPDIFVPVETGANFKYYNALINKGVIFEYAFELTDNLRKVYSNKISFDKFNATFKMTPAMFADLIKRGDKDSVKYDPNSAKQMQGKIGLLLKAYIARNIYGDAGFFPVLLEDDKIFDRAKKEIARMK